MEHNDKETVKNLIKIFVVLILFTIVCAQIVTIIKDIRTNMYVDKNISLVPSPKKLITGEQLNMKLKDSSVADEENTKINKIVFDYWNNGYREKNEELYTNKEWTNGIPVDNKQEGTIRLFRSEDGSNIYILSESSIYANLDSSKMFYNLKAVTELKFNNLNISNVENMSGMFGNCGKIELLDLSSFDTINVTNMKELFAQNKNLKTIYVSEKWSIDRVNHTDILENEQPFLGCESLMGGEGTSYDISNIDISYARVDEVEENKKGYFTYKEEGITFFKDMNLN